MAPLDRPDDPRFPRLKLALADVAELGPGDAIYNPPMWRHLVVSLRQLNTLVKYWWKLWPTQGHVRDTMLGRLLHYILAFKPLPPAERAAWRGLLNDYVFVTRILPRTSRLRVAASPVCLHRSSWRAL